MKKLIRWIRQSDRIDALEKDLKDLKLTLAEDLRLFLKEFEPRMDRIEEKTGMKGVEVAPFISHKLEQNPLYKLVTFKFMKEYVAKQCEALEKAMNQQSNAKH